MKKSLSALIIFFVMFLLFPAMNIKTSENPANSRFAKDHIIVKLKKEITAAAPSLTGTAAIERISNISKEIGIQTKGFKQLFAFGKNTNAALYSKYELNEYFIVTIDDNRDIKDICELYQSNKEVDFSEPDFIGEAAGKSSIETKQPQKPNDEFFDRQWGLYNDGSTRTTAGTKGKFGADLNVLNAWDIEKGSEDVIVAIMDSGVKLDHPDLSGRIWVNKSETKNGRDDDGNNFVDDINGWNFAYDNSDVIDDGGHGTNIAGTIGAGVNNSIGYSGIDQKCRLMICKNLDDQNLGEYSWWSASLYYAANNGARVINMSEGGYDYSKTLNAAIDYAYDAGCLICASMMNKNNSDNYYPASLKNVMAIGATDTDDSRCRQFTWGGGSNWGKHIAVVAPGNRIYGLDFKDNYNYDVYWSGTSQATAYITGVAALLLGQDPSRTNRQLKEIICSTAKDQVGDPREDEKGWDQYYGWGRVDLFAALNYDLSPSEKREIKDNDQKEDIRHKENNDENKRAKSEERNSSQQNDRINDDDSNKAHKVEH